MKRIKKKDLMDKLEENNILLNTILKDMKVQYKIPNEFMELVARFIDWDMGNRPQRYPELWYRAKELSNLVGHHKEHITLIGVDKNE